MFTITVDKQVASIIKPNTPYKLVSVDTTDKKIMVDVLGTHMTFKVDGIDDDFSFEDLRHRIDLPVFFTFLSAISFQLRIKELENTCGPKETKEPVSTAQSTGRGCSFQRREMNLF